MKYSPHIIGLAILLSASTGAWAKPAYVLTTVNLRAAPGTTNEIVAKIPGGSLIDAAQCTGGWCAVTWQDKSGFAIESALDLSGRVPQRRSVSPRYYDDGPDYVVEGPPVYYGPPPPPFYYDYGPHRRHRYWGHRW